MRTCDPKRGLLILESAAQLFAKHRYHEVRMDDIAEQAGVAKGTLYRYFQDKEELYLALAIHGLERLFEESRATVAESGDAEAKLHAFIAHIVGFYEQYPYFLELIQRIETSNTAASVEALQTIRKQFLHLVTGLIEELNGPDQSCTQHPQIAALALLGMIRGILRFTPQPWPAHLADWIYHQFKHGLCAEAPCDLDDKPVIA
jgi:AcrR family transcriptional regulator